MTDHQRYLFDLQGYVVIPDALSPDHVRELNALMDARIAADCDADMRTHRWVGMLDWGEPCRRLIDVDTVLPSIEALVGGQCRLLICIFFFQYLLAIKHFGCEAK